jgi:hypothetical protein
LVAAGLWVITFTKMFFSFFPHRFWLSSMHLLGNTLCVFTAGATSALKLVGEAFPWSSKSEYLYMMENHNSKLGI